MPDDETQGLAMMRVPHIAGIIRAANRSYVRDAKGKSHLLRKKPRGGSVERDHEVRRVRMPLDPCLDGGVKQQVVRAMNLQLVRAGGRAGSVAGKGLQRFHQQRSVFGKVRHLDAFVRRVREAISDRLVRRIDNDPRSPRGAKQPANAQNGFFHAARVRVDPGGR